MTKASGAQVASTVVATQPFADGYASFMRKVGWPHVDICSMTDNAHSSEWKERS